MAISPHWERVGTLRESLEFEKVQVTSELSKHKKLRPFGASVIVRQGVWSGGGLGFPQDPPVGIVHSISSSIHPGGTSSVRVTTFSSSTSNMMVSVGFDGSLSSMPKTSSPETEK